MRIRNALVPAVVAALAFGFTAVPTSDTAALSDAGPGGAAVTNPIGSPGWLPVIANENPTFGTFRFVVKYDQSLDPVSGEATDLLADGPWGMRIFSDSIVDTHADPPSMRMVGHSPWVTSLDDAGLPPELQDVDRAFIGVAGDVTDGDCAGLDAADPAGSLSYAYSFTFTVDGDVAAEDCQVVDGHGRDADGNIVSTTITEFVPGFWVDVRWPYETAGGVGSGGEGHTFRQVWYGAIPGFSTDDPTAFAAAADSGNSTTLYSPTDEIERHIIEDTTPGPGVPPVTDGCPVSTGTGTVVDFTVPAVPAGASLQVDLYFEGDWDLLVTNKGETQSSGNFHLNERVIVGVSEGDVVKIEGCNFAGGPTATVVIGWTKGF